MSQQAGNGQVTFNQYDAQGRLVSRKLVVGLGIKLVELSWRHDAQGNVRQQTELWSRNGAGVTGKSQTTVMDYDDRNRLREETVVPAAGVTTRTVHGYDEAITGRARRLTLMRR